MKFHYDSEIPAEILPALQKYLQPLEWLVPIWCARVVIFYSAIPSDEHEGAAITSSSRYQYRDCALTFYPSFLTEDDERRQLHVIHDLLHAFSSPLADYARTSLEELSSEYESSMFQAHLLRELTQRNEAWVQDMADCIQTHLMASD